MVFGLVSDLASELTVAALYRNYTGFPNSLLLFFKRNSLSIYLPKAMSKKPVEKRIMVFGTFDGLHLGHLNFFKQARRLVLGGHLIVSVARDRNVFKIKGKYPVLGEKQRVTLVKKSKLAHKVVLGGLKDYLPHITKINPDIIALGYDQKAYVKNLKKDITKRFLKIKIVRLKPYKEKIYKNTLLKKAPPRS